MNKEIQIIVSHFKKLGWQPRNHKGQLMLSFPNNEFSSELWIRDNKYLCPYGFKPKDYTMIHPGTEGCFYGGAVLDIPWEEDFKSDNDPSLWGIQKHFKDKGFVVHEEKGKLVVRNNNKYNKNESLKILFKDINDIYSKAIVDVAADLDSFKATFENVSYLELTTRFNDLFFPADHSYLKITSFNTSTYDIYFTVNNSYENKQELLRFNNHISDIMICGSDKYEVKKFEVNCVEEIISFEITIYVK